MIMAITLCNYTYTALVGNKLWISGLCYRTQCNETSISIITYFKSCLLVNLVNLAKHRLLSFRHFSFTPVYLDHACPSVLLTSAQALRQVFLNPNRASTSFLEGSASRVLLMMCLRTTASPALQSLPVSSRTAGRRQLLTSCGTSSSWMSDTSKDSGSWLISEWELAGFVNTRKTLKDLHSQ